MRSGMKRHQRRDQLPKAGRTDKLRAIERMESGSAHRRRVADIVQPRRRHQTVPCLRIEMPAQALGCRRDPPHMRQPPRLPRQPRLGLPPCTLRQNPAHTRQPTSPIAAAQTPTADARRSRDRTARRNPAATCGLRYAPSAPVRWRSRPRRSLRFALRPPPHQPVYDQSASTSQRRQHPGITTSQSCPRSSPLHGAPWPAGALTLIYQLRPAV